MTVTALLRSRIPRKGDVRFWRPTAPASVGVEFNYLPWLEREFPELAPGYRQLYRRNSPPDVYAQTVTGRVAELKKKYGLADRPPAAKARAARVPPPVQLSLLA